MSRNLFVSYDLNNPGQNYEKVIAEIKRRGAWAKVEYSLFYLDTNETAQAVASAVWRVMDSNDKLIVIDTTANLAVWYGIDQQASEFMKQRWNNLRLAA
jgi:hypothetical protein